MARNFLLQETQSVFSSWCKRRWFHNSVTSYMSCSPERKNEIEIQMLSKILHQQIFKNSESSSENNLTLIQNHLRRHGLWNKETTKLQDVDLQLPKLFGKSIDDHFCDLGLQQVADYKALAERLVKSNVPPLPPKWSETKGWTKYHVDGTPEAVSFPDDEALVFDIECLVPEGDFPTMATAVSDKYWYSWVSDYVVDDRYRWSNKPQLSDLIPLETKKGGNAPPGGKWKKRLVVGHNVGFDRSFVKEQYYIQGTDLRFLDTMSMHIAICGLTTFQRMLYMASSNDSKRKEIREYKEKQKWQSQSSDQWKYVSTMNNLNDVYQLHCDGEPLEKTTRNVFIQGTMADVREQFQHLMTYCSKDVIATHAVLQKLWPEYLKRFPHPVTLTGMLEMGSAYLPINTNWKRYVQQSNTTYDELQHELKNQLISLANDACEVLEGDLYKDDPWLWDLDWSTTEYRLLKSEKKSLDPPSDNSVNVVDDNSLMTAKDCVIESRENQEEVEELCQRIRDTASRIPKHETFKAGYPNWYRGLCPRYGVEDWYPGPSLISTQVRVTPKLLRLTWNGYPVHYNDTHGWGYLVPNYNGNGLIEELEDEEKKPSCAFPLRSFEAFLAATQPEFYGEDITASNLPPGDPLGRDFDSQAMDMVEKSKHWKSTNIKRRQLHPKVLNYLKSVGGGPHNIGIPGVSFYRIPHKNGFSNRVGNPLAKDYLHHVEDGTLRAATGDSANRVLLLGKMCSYWRNNQERIEGQMSVWLKKSELHRSVTSQEGYTDDVLYGAIVPRIVPAGTVTRRAVEPTWLTASNAYTDRIGSELKAMIQVPPGYHFVGADVDSQELWIASILGDATFQKIHGCTALGWMTLQGNKADKTDLHSKTAETVGISRDHAKVMNYARIYGAGQKYAEKLLMQFNPKLTVEEANKKAKKMYSATKGKRSNNGEWIGGSESYMFNGLEAIAKSDEPATPVLGCRISKALEPENVLNDFITSRVNWVVQSSAVDYLHLMLVCMRWLLETFGIRGRFCISIHDEVRYIVRSEDRYRAALALQMTNLLTRSMFAYKLGMNDLPQSIAFFSSVDIDTCLRKEVNMDCQTPSNPHGLQRGYNIPQGEALDIYQIIETTAGSLDAKKPCQNRNKVQKEKEMVDVQV